MWSAAVDYFFYGSISPLAAVLGFGLSIAQDSSKLDILRLLVLSWCAVSLLLVIPAAVSEGFWLPAIRAGLLGGAVAGLMFDGLREPTVAILATIGVGAVFI